MDKSQSSSATADVSDQSVVPVKRVRVSRWDTAPAVVESVMPPISLPPPPPPPPPVFSFSKAMPLNAISSSDNTSTVRGDIDVEISDDAPVKKGNSLSAIPPPPPPPRFPSSSSSSSSSRLEVAESKIDDIDMHSQIDSSTALFQEVGTEEDDIPLETDGIKQPIVHTIVVTGVRSDILRLLCDNVGNVLGAYGEVVSTPASRRGEKEPVEVIASTGECSGE